ncbi:Hypothetical protein ORPV_767 [Orpheovirus IHUMI-LCC2]|uniref:Uncharacterized protein n=1 Tax=Orpheovirus IHUMI-LCC2 TaxID=2023057 RepID=A0A2I2L581_9VIRU|nr:Hypothetical protein ORPV_767 [Orpheovirus IHUMI-LCC2]SNW62671.1 Hypothetical protein ORPV_767 [Orpheovirus IHUMI-LCC2]
MEYKDYLSTLPLQSLINMLRIDINLPSRIFGLSREDNNIDKFVKNDKFKKYIVKRYINDFEYFPSDGYISSVNFIDYKLYNNEEIEKILLILYPDLDRIQFYRDLETNIKAIYGEADMNDFWYNILYRILKNTNNDKDRILKFCNELNIMDEVFFSAALKSNNEYFAQHHPLITRNKGYGSMLYNVQYINYWYYVRNDGDIIDGTWENPNVFTHLSIFCPSPKHVTHKYIDILRELAENYVHIYNFIRGYNDANNKQNIEIHEDVGNNYYYGYIIGSNKWDDTLLNNIKNIDSLYYLILKLTNNSKVLSILYKKDTNLFINVVKALSENRYISYLSIITMLVNPRTNTFMPLNQVNDIIYNNDVFSADFRNRVYDVVKLMKTLDYDNFHNYLQEHVPSPIPEVYNDF